MAHTPFGLRSIFDLIAIKIFSIADRHQLQFWFPMEVASPTLSGWSHLIKFKLKK